MRAPILLIVSVALPLLSAQAVAEGACPATTDRDPLFGTSIPGWYGTEALAVQLSSPARWSTTRPGNLIGEKLFWRSAGFRPGTESDLEITVRSLDGAPVTGSISRATNAYIPAEQRGRPLTEAESQGVFSEMLSSPDRWRMLTGVDFPEAGCWEVSATYLGQTLTFVVQTVDSAEAAAAQPDGALAATE